MKPRLARGVPVPEHRQELFARDRIDLLLGERPGRLDRRAELLEVGGAVRAPGDVRFEPAPVAAGERTLEGSRAELGELLARERPGRKDRDARAHAATSGSRYLSSAALTLDRARWRRTRWLPSEIISASATSSAFHPRMSRSRITSRCASGSISIAALITRSASLFSAAS